MQKDIAFFLYKQMQIHPTEYTESVSVVLEFIFKTYFSIYYRAVMLSIYNAYKRVLS